MPKIEVDVHYYADDDAPYTSDQDGKLVIAVPEITPFLRGQLSAAILREASAEIYGLTGAKNAIGQVVKALELATQQGRPLTAYEAEAAKTADELEAEGRDPGLRDRGPIDEIDAAEAAAPV